MTDRSLAKHVREKWMAQRGEFGSVESESSYDERINGFCDEDENEEDL